MHADEGGRGVEARRRGTAQPRVEVTPVSWRAHSEFGLEHWIEHGRRLGSVGRGIAWWIGDWLAYGNERYGEKYARATVITGYDAQSLMNMVYVASRFAPDRRVPELSWSHHAELAALDEAEQDRWLACAAEERMSVRSLRTELRGLRARAKRASQASPTLRVPRAELCPTCGAPMEAEEP